MDYLQKVLIGYYSCSYPQSTLKDTPPCRSHSGSASYETYVAGQEDSGCVAWVETVYIVY